MEEKLKSLHKKVAATYYEGGEHSLQPTPEPIKTLVNEIEDDFSAGRTIEIPCGSKTLVIDWSKPTDSIELCSWR